MNKKNFWQNFSKPIIGLSPMDGWTDSAFRRICKLVNQDIILYTEFTSADGLYHNFSVLRNKLRFFPEEHPIIAQIFGKDQKAIVESAKYCEDQGFDGVDINMGCPSKKIVRSEQGVALRRNKQKAFELVNAVSEAVQIPVSVKSRLGWKDASDLFEFCKGVEEAGANMIAIHARTYQDPYKATPNFEPLYQIKEELKIPLLGNGGIQSIKDGLLKLRNLDGFLIGQASMGNPWVFSNRENISWKEKIQVIKRHVYYMVELVGEDKAMLDIRKHLLAYIKGIKYAKKYRIELSQVSSVSEIDNILDNLLIDENTAN